MDFGNIVKIPVPENGILSDPYHRQVFGCDNDHCDLEDLKRKNCFRKNSEEYFDMVKSGDDVVTFRMNVPDFIYRKLFNVCDLVVLDYQKNIDEENEFWIHPQIHKWISEHWGDPVDGYWNEVCNNAGFQELPRLIRGDFGVTDRWMHHMTASDLLMKKFSVSGYADAWVYIFKKMDSKEDDVLKMDVGDDVLKMFLKQVEKEFVNG